MTTFNFIEVKGSARSKFNEKHYKDCVFDIQIFNFADLLQPSYNGGYWKYMEHNSIGFYVLDGSDKTILRNFSGDNYEMNSVLAGMIITLFALIYRIEKSQDEELLAKYEALKNLIYDYAEATNEFTAAYKMLD